jgi:hypothetical protein
VVPQAKLEEFRTNNIAVSQERDGLKSRIDKLAALMGEGGDDDAFAAEIAELRKMAQQVKDGKLKGTDSVEGEVARRVAEMKRDYERQLQDQATKATAAEKRALEADQKYRRSLIDRAVTDAVLDDKSGAEQRALPDILSRAYAVFKIEDDGKLVARDGEAVIYGADGATPMTPLEWLGKLREQAPYFFKGSNGGGASGTTGTKTMGGYTAAEFAKLPALKRLEIANAAGVRK